MALLPDTDLENLLDLARDKSADGKSQLVQIVGDLFFEESRVLNERERSLMTDILKQLIQDVEHSVRKALADKMAEDADAPNDLISILANDDEDVAHNILLKSEVLQDLELVEIIQHRTFEHQLTIAMRNKVSETVSDALVETGNTDVIKTLVENETAQISDDTIETIVDASKTNEPLQGSLLNRPDLSPHLAKRMYWWVSAALRKHIVEQYQIDPTELDQKIESTIKDLLGEPESGGGEGTIDTGSLEQASRLAQKLADKQAITPQVLLQTLRKGEVKMFEGMFGMLTGLRPNLIRRLVFEPGGEGLAIACKAIQMTKPDFGSLFLLSRSARPGDKVVDPREVSRAMTFFDRLRPDTAQKVVERWKLDPNYLFALKQIEGGGDQQAAAAE
ncbi:MAG: hypothetical protein CMM52_14975 [Rhodospirillaceae bacterium]|nr:hypothetical protein [Rhodospirillaceae bacterium]|tara:strand:+ start:21412 stop:22584 length:1173 start_codon:yes stop_codon:yes gene_type:complete